MPLTLYPSSTLLTWTIDDIWHLMKAVHTSHSKVSQRLGFLFEKKQYFNCKQLFILGFKLVLLVYEEQHIILI